MPELNWIYIRSDQELLEALPDLEREPLLAVDTETAGLDPFRHPIFLLQLGTLQRQWIIDCRSVSTEPLRHLLESLRPKVLHNAKFDYKMVKQQLGIRMENPVDTYLLEKILHNGKPKVALSLQALASKYLRWDLDKSLQGSFLNLEGEVSEAQLRYAAMDVLAAVSVAQAQLEEIRREGLVRTAQLECLAVNALADLELHGIWLDRSRWTTLTSGLQQEVARSKDALDDIFKPYFGADLFGHMDLHYDNDGQVLDALRKLNLRVENLQRSTLEKISHPAIPPLIAYRDAHRFLTLYGENFFQYIHPFTGRVHAEFLQLGAETGRIACMNPNLQSIPSTPPFRQCFVARPGQKMVLGDYEGCELRILAELSQDALLLKIFQQGGDLHAMVATQVFQQPVSRVEHPELRARAKAINFGLAYGMGAQRLATQLGCTLEDAQAWIHSYFQAFPRVRDYLEESARATLHRGYAESLGGRKRYFQPPMSEDELAGQERQARNMPVQATNADMIKLALVWLREELLRRASTARIIHTIHDEIVVECGEDDAAEVAGLLGQTMRRAGEHFLPSVPVMVSTEICDSWK